MLCPPNQNNFTQPPRNYDVYESRVYIVTETDIVYQNVIKNVMTKVEIIIRETQMYRTEQNAVHSFDKPNYRGRDANCLHCLNSRK